MYLSAHSFITSTLFVPVCRFDRSIEREREQGKQFWRETVATTRVVLSLKNAKSQSLVVFFCQVQTYLACYFKKLLRRVKVGAMIDEVVVAKGIAASSSQSGEIAASATCKPDILLTETSPQSQRTAACQSI